jgi:hypothetical protein
MAIFSMIMADHLRGHRMRKKAEQDVVLVRYNRKCTILVLVGKMLHLIYVAARANTTCSRENEHPPREIGIAQFKSSPVQWIPYSSELLAWLSKFVTRARG